MNFLKSDVNIKCSKTDDNKPIRYENLDYEISIYIIEELSRFEYYFSFSELTLQYIRKFYHYENIMRKYLQKTVIAEKRFFTFNEIYKIFFNDQSLEIPETIIIPLLFKILNLETLGPLLIDNKIEEIYVDGHNSSIYIDHSEYGRCTVKNTLKEEEVHSFISRVQIENNFSLNRLNPTMKADFNSDLFRTRVSVDIRPLTIDEIHLDIRKFPKIPFTILDLINNKSITVNQSLFLIFAIRNRISITICGPPNSGKTTLQNILLSFVPDFWRVLSIEDVQESISKKRGHFIRFKLGYDPKEIKLLSKSLEVQKILHRSPDIINLGELSLKSHFLAFSNILSVGLPSIQTIHGKSPEHLFNRLKDVYNIPLNLIKTSLPHIIITMDVNWEESRKRRKLLEIHELTLTGQLKVIDDDQINSILNSEEIMSKIVSFELVKNSNQKLNIDEEIKIIEKAIFQSP